MRRLAAVGLGARAHHQDRRIDFIFLIPPASGIAGIFGGVANPFVPACGAAPLPICWPSDHDGVQLDLTCR